MPGEGLGALKSAIMASFADLGAEGDAEGTAGEADEGADPSKSNPKGSWDAELAVGFEGADFEGPALLATG
jgi:hypothetical protein